MPGGGDGGGNRTSDGPWVVEVASLDMHFLLVLGGVLDV
jgi:hypothetical protein